VLAAIGALVTALALFVGRVEPKFLTFLDPPLLVSFAALVVALGRWQHQSQRIENGVWSGYWYR